MTNNDHTSIILHLPFHPNDPPSYKIQQAWRDTVASPKYHMPLPHMRNPKSKEKCQIERMIIAYHRVCVFSVRVYVSLKGTLVTLPALVFA